MWNTLECCSNFLLFILPVLPADQRRADCIYFPRVLGMLHNENTLKSSLHLKKKIYISCRMCPAPRLLHFSTRSHQRLELEQSNVFDTSDINL